MLPMASSRRRRRSQREKLAAVSGYEERGAELGVPEGSVRTMAACVAQRVRGHSAPVVPSAAISAQLSKEPKPSPCSFPLSTTLTIPR